ncbi:MAG TPA: hypothetical protein VGQ37_25555 [Vicinamibacterales bacterium]|nr:hypothetical protein [Vicinamibacterales bacterium]
MIDRPVGEDAGGGEAGMAGPDHDSGVVLDYATSTVTFTGLVMMS